MAHKIIVERRRHQPRLAAHMAARIVVPGQVSPALCFVEEISPGGARLHIDPEWVLPRALWLKIEGDSILHQACVVWRDRWAVGVEFADEAQRAWWDHSQTVNNKVIQLTPRRWA
jgi:hypothetical protein